MVDERLIVATMEEKRFRSLYKFFKWKAKVVYRLAKKRPGDKEGMEDAIAAVLLAAEFIGVDAKIDWDRCMKQYERHLDHMYRIGLWMQEETEDGRR